MSRFTIEQIGDDVEPTAGIPDGCDVCGHCTVLKEVFGALASTPCRGVRPQPSPAGTEHILTVSVRKGYSSTETCEDDHHGRV